MKVCVSLLAYNESASIEETVREAYRSLEKSGLNFELWVFDNHSTDETPKILERLLKEFPNLRHFRQPENIGYAMSSRSSFKVPEADVYVTLDGDGQFSVDDVPLMIAPLQKGYDMVVGWRVRRNDPWDRVLMNKGFNFVTKLILGCKLNDLNCGYRALNKKAAQAIEVLYREKFVGPEIFARSKQNRLKATEVPVRHFERRAGVSVYSGNKLQSIFNMVRYLFKLRKEIYSQQSALALEKAYANTAQE